MPIQANDRVPLCGNCKHFVAGGLCELVKGQINSKSTCDLHEFGNPRPIDTKVDPTHNKLEVNYKPGFITETISENIAQKVIQMEHELLARGIPEEEVHRAVIAYFSQQEPPYAMPWPGPVTGLDLAGRIDPYIAPDTTGVPLTNFTGLPKNVEPYPTPNKSPYGIGTTSQPYPSFYSPSPNMDSISNSYDIRNNSYPYDSAVWNGLASDVNSEPSMHNEYGYNVATTIPTFPDSYEALHNDSQIRSRVIEPSGAYQETFDSKELRAGIEIELEHTDDREIARQIAIDHLNEDPKYYTKLLTHVEPEKKHLLETSFEFNKIAEAKKDSTKKKYLKLLATWAVLLGGAIGIDAIIKKYLDSDMEKPLEIIAEYNYHGHDADDECAKFAGKRFNLLETHNRPVIPSEKLGYTTTHPNCICDWIVKLDSHLPLNKITKNEQAEIDKIENHITKAAKKGKLHKVDKDGKLSTKTTKKNPLKELCSCMNVTLPSFRLDLPTKSTRRSLQEAISNLRSEFAWLNDDYISNAKKLAEDAGGQLYLVRAAAESITDHRSEGEIYRRKLSADELNSMTRTAIGKSMDINHQPEFETDATILDAEFDKIRKEIQVLVVERDPGINQAIDDGKITAVSINGGMPRSESVEPCDHNCESDSCELCLVPKGVVLGELDNIGMTWVVSDKNGLYWNGHFVPSAEPGIKVTRIEQL
jgi:hypothetical protein